MIKIPRIIDVIERPSDEEVLDQMNTSVRSWIQNDLGRLNSVQKVSIPRIMFGKHTLVMSPTGSGKTLAAFLGIISKLSDMQFNNILEKKIYVLYVSPLKALNNDIHKNLEIPLQGMKKYHEGIISVAKRTGDTSSKDRAKMLSKPPHILITTPESLALMLTAPKFKENLRSIKWIVIDEIHALADNKRGTLLSLCLERLEFYLNENPVRIGLSATVEPSELVAQYLIGSRDTDVGIINMGDLRDQKIKVITPTQNLIHAPINLIRKRHREIIEKEIREHRTSIIFTNTRFLAEKMALDMSENYPDLKDYIAVHHGSISKNVRLEIEENLKNGKIKAVFTSTSLELGIDIGTIDHTTQIGSPKTVRSFTQRIGRSGHSANLQSKGNLLVFDRDDLIECMAIARLTSEGQIDRIRIPKSPVDVLYQMLIGMAVERRWGIDEAYNVIQKSYPYMHLSIENFRKIIISAANTTNDDNAWKYAKIWVDEEINEFGRRKRARQSYMQNIGTIPDVSMVEVILETYRTKIGKISDRFAENLNKTDVFVLGGKTYKFLRTIGNKVLVKEAFGLVPTIPSWIGEAQSRTFEVSKEISLMFTEMDKNNKNINKWLIERYHITHIEAKIVINYIKEQKSVSLIPTFNRLVVEEYIEPSGAITIIVLSIYGRETNLVLAQALATKLSRELDTNISTIATDNGIILRIPIGLNYDFNKLLVDIKADDIIDNLDKRLRDSELFKNRFRHVATRSLMILKNSGTRKNSVNQQLKLSRWLIKSLPEDNPIVLETIREIMYDTYNIESAYNLLKRIENKSIEVISLASGIPSPMSHNILLNDNSDIILLEDKKSLLLNLHQQVLSRLLPDISSRKNIFNKDQIVKAFSDKLNHISTGSKQLSVERFAEFSLDKGSNFYQLCSEYTGISIVEINEIISNNDIIVPWMNSYTTKEVLPYHTACHSEEIWKSYDERFEEIKERSRELSPTTAIEYLILYLLKYSGPIKYEEICTKLQKNTDQIKPVLENMIRKHSVLKGSFLTEKQEFMLYDDHTLLLEVNKSKISLEDLTIFRLDKLRLSSKLQSETMTIGNYLDENGPARDTVELTSRLPNFNWHELRDLLAGREIYFGRFLGRRLVFVSKNQIKHLITITRDKKVEFDSITREILLLIQEMPGMTIKNIRKFVVQPNSIIQSSINILEQELYISRTGWDLSLTQGGFPNPQYIPLPQIKIGEISYIHSVKWMLKSCLTWYGPLTLQDLLRITRLPYDIVEQVIQDLEVVVKEIYSYTYYGLKRHFEKLKNKEKFNDENFLLSPLDPYFYMISGSFKQDQLPRQTKLMLVKNGKTLARIEITIPDKDILQVLNIQISNNNMQNFDLIEDMGRQLIRIGGRAYSTNAVIIEEINFKAANHKENRSIVLALKRVSFKLVGDSLIGGTKSTGKIDYKDIIETRLLILDILNDRRFDDIEKMFSHYDTLAINRAVSLLDMNEKKAKLLISRALRKGKIHHKAGVLYHPSSYPHPKNVNNLLINIFQTNKRALTISEIISLSDYTHEQIEKAILQGIKDDIIENISPFSKTTEYKLTSIDKSNRKNRITNLLIKLINKYGPTSFSQIIIQMKNVIKTSRVELLIILADLVGAARIFTTIAEREETTELIYYNSVQQQILTDKTRTHRLSRWRIYESDDILFEYIANRSTHIITHFGTPVVELQVKTSIDEVIIESLTFAYNIEYTIESKLTEMIIELEEFFFSKGYKLIKINKIQSAFPEFWLKRGLTNEN